RGLRRLRRALAARPRLRRPAGRGRARAGRAPAPGAAGATGACPAHPGRPARPAGPAAAGAPVMTAHHPSGGRPGREVRDWLDVAIEWASGATAVGMFAYGFALSYAVLHAIAAAAGLAPWAARVWPLGFESFMASAALNALAEQRRRRHLAEWHERVPWYPWTLTGLTA